jgi:hypothetical protein
MPLRADSGAVVHLIYGEMPSRADSGADVHLIYGEMPSWGRRAYLTASLVVGTLDLIDV